VAAAEVALARNDSQAARRSFTRAQELDPKGFEPVAGLATLDLIEKKPSAAVARVEQQLANSPGDARVHLLAANVYRASGDNAKAEQQLRAAIQQNPSDFGAYAMLAGLYASEKRLKEARESLEAVLAKDPKEIGALTLVGMLYQVEGNQPAARERYERALQIDPGAAVAANNLAFLYADEGGNLDVALQLAQTAKQHLPNSAEVDDTLGWVYYKKGLPALAMPAFERAAQAAPKRANYQYHLGLAHAGMGQKAQAKVAFDAALKINPALPGAAEALEALKTSR
jgi:Tfp pilus assembly protein PilF